MENASKALIIAGAILISILLITIGIVLINSGKDITTTGTSEMARQNIQTFNSKFTAYQGTIKGSQVTSLLETVRSCNVTDPSHTVTVYTSVSNLTANNISATKNYTVTLYYNGEKARASATTAIISPTTAVSEAGYIDQILIAAAS